MSRMSNEEAIAIIKKEAECVKRQGKTGECCRDDLGCGACDLVEKDTSIFAAYFLAIEALNRPHGEWIPCSERLPEECEYCLGWIERDCWKDGHDEPIRVQECAIGWHIEGRWHFDGYNGNTKCIAWMPLPEPYKKVGEDN